MTQINSEDFGQTFWLDEENNLMSCPTFIDGKPDKLNSGYVCDWEDWENVNYFKLFEIISTLISQKLNLIEVKN